MESCCFFTVCASEDEDRLMIDLFKGYNNLIQPTKVNNETMIVNFGLQLVLLINVVRSAIST